MPASLVFHEVVTFRRHNGVGHLQISWTVVDDMDRDAAGIASVCVNAQNHIATHEAIAVCDALEQAATAARAWNDSRAVYVDDELEVQHAAYVDERGPAVPAPGVEPIRVPQYVPPIPGEAPTTHERLHGAYDDTAVQRAIHDELRR